MNALATELLSKQNELELKLDQLGSVLKAAPRGQFGLTLDEAKTPEWRKAKFDYDLVWKSYQHVNKQLSKIRKPNGFEIIDGKRVVIYKYKD